VARGVLAQRRPETHHQDYDKKNPVRYKVYKWHCGRQQRLDQVWGKTE
jgi:peptide-methionine (S)-S-oxide reductase